MKTSTKTMCPMNCHPTLCGMEVTVEGNRLLSIKGDQDNPDSQGFLCVRGRAAQEIIGNSKRILQPLIRANRSDPFVRTDNEQAFTHIEETLRSIQPAELGIWLGHGDAATNYGTRLGGLLSQRFAHLYGCQWWHPAMICWGLSGFGFGLTGLLDVNTKEDMSAHSDLIILWGANLASQPNTAPHLQKAKKRGARIIAIDIRKTEACSLADEYYLIKPGTDAALALAIARQLVINKRIDKPFIEAHCVGFDAFADSLQQMTSEWAESVTNIPARLIEKIAKNYADCTRAMILVGGSSMHKNSNGWQASRAIACLPALTGKIGTPGAGLGPRHGAKSYGQILNTLLPESGNACVSIIPNQMSAMVNAMEQGKIKVLLLSGTDMASSFANTEALGMALSKVNLVICHDLFMNDTIRQYADIVLPATAWLEQLGCKMTNTHLYLMDKILAAPAQALSLSQILQRLANNLDVEEFYPWDSDEGYINAVIDHAASNHATVASLRLSDNKQAMAISHVAYNDYRFPTPSGKIEFYSQRAVDAGLPALPVFTKPTIELDYPLQFRQGRTLKHFHGFYDHGRALPSLEKYNRQPELWVSIADADQRHILDGEEIVIKNQRGQMHAIARVTDKIQTGTVWMRDGWSDLNKLTSGQPCLPEQALDLFPFGVGQSAYEAFVNINKYRP